VCHSASFVGLSAVTVARDPAVDHKRSELFTGFTFTFGNVFDFNPIGINAPVLSSAELLCIARLVEAVKVVVDQSRGVLERPRVCILRVVLGVDGVEVSFIDINAHSGKLAVG